MDDYSFTRLFLSLSLSLSLSPDLLFPIPSLFKSKSDAQKPTGFGGLKRLSGLINGMREAFCVWHWSVGSEEIKGCRPSSSGGKKGGIALPEWNNKCLGVCRSCENTGTLSLVAAVALRISEDCCHVRDRCTKCVFGRLRGSRDAKKNPLQTIRSW